MPLLPSLRCWANGSCRRREPGEVFSFRRLAIGGWLVVRRSKFGVQSSAFKAQAPRVSPPRQLRNIALVGFMGTGKSTVGHILADLLQFQFVDTDRTLEQRAGKRVAEIFAADGEPAFRALESAL